jgi:hypothetical protein
MPVTRGGVELNALHVRSDQQRRCRVVMIGAGMANMNKVAVESLEPLSDFWQALDPPRDRAQFRETGMASAKEIAGTKRKPQITHLRRRNFMTRSESGP